MFEKVLTATGMLEACDPALLSALEMAKQNHGKLFMLHVLEPTYIHECGPEESVTDFRTGEGVAPSHEYKETVKEELDQKCAGALKSYGNYEINIVYGRPGIEIRRWARKYGADLIVLGPHVERPEEEKKLTGAPRGNTVEDVITYVTAPVMIVNGFVKRESLDFKKILVCIDFSKSCEYACRFAVKLAQRYGAKLFLFHMSPAYAAGVREADKEREKLAAFCNIPEGVAHEYMVWQGTMPHLEILKSSHEKQVDLVVMGSYTRETSEKSYVGSAVEQVSSESSCPVAVVTHPDAVAKGEG